MQVGGNVVVGIVHPLVWLVDWQNFYVCVSALSWVVWVIGRVHCFASLRKQAVGLMGCGRLICSLACSLTQQLLLRACTIMCLCLWAVLLHSRPARGVTFMVCVYQTLLCVSNVRVCVVYYPPCLHCCVWLTI
jgi:hypothetical protein